MKSHCFKLYHTYFNSFSSSNVGNFFWSWILKDCIEGVVLCSCSPQNVNFNLNLTFAVCRIREYLPGIFVVEPRSWCWESGALRLQGVFTWSQGGHVGVPNKSWKGAELFCFCSNKFAYRKSSFKSPSQISLSLYNKLPSFPGKKVNKPPRLYPPSLYPPPLPWLFFTNEW